MIKIELNIEEAMEIIEAMDFTACETGCNETFKEAFCKIQKALKEEFEKEKRDR